tara:strand:+ start:576 stop:1328 length:753 start_codon:yes stop_codon:yes gene_type:complete
MIYSKLISRIIRFLKSLLSNSQISDHRFQNKNQVTNSDIILYLLKKKNFIPNFIVDVGCGYGEWTKKLLKIFPSSSYFLFDADKNNNNKLYNLKEKNKNINYKICLLSNDKKYYKFYNMGYGSSIFEEQTDYKRKIEEILSTRLKDELPKNLINFNNNLIKLDVQGSELKILDGLEDLIESFEVIIMEVSLHNYNKNSPLFDEVINYMRSKSFRLYDIFDPKRLGKDNSFLLQFDCMFVRNDSKLFNVKF